MTRLLPFFLLIIVAARFVFTGVSNADDAVGSLGADIFKAKCAACHGESGNGVAGKYDDPLSGDLSLAELTELVADTMPMDKPETVTGDEARAVAAYMFDSFYNQPVAPAQQRLSRLTASQLRQSLSDIAAHFLGAASVQSKHGLHGEYFSGSSPRRDRRKIDRLDPVLDFDFKNNGPGDGIDAAEFSIQWTGGLKVDVAGRYELVLRSSCACMCYFGDNDRELIDNHVQSENRTEFRRAMQLTAGRVYPLRIVMYQRKRKTEQPPASISLSWVTPHAPEQIIPTRHLLADNQPGAFALQSKLPPDDRSYGYERGIAVDRQWDDSTTAAAIEFAQFAAVELWPAYERKFRNVSTQNRQRLRQFLTDAVATAFRGPLDDATRTLYIDRQIDACPDDADAIRRSLLFALKSPRFLYPTLDHDRSPSQRAANRLALTLYDSLPADDWLVREIERNGLQSEQQVRDAATRMMDDFRVRAKTRGMLYAWCNVEHLAEFSKDEEQFPDFEPELVGDLRDSFDATLDAIVWSETSDFRDLLQADWTYTNQRLHQYYGDAWKPSEDITNALSRSPASKTEHAGVITHPYLMSGLAYRDSTSPIHRGVFLIRYTLGRTLNPPQEAFTPLSPKLHPDLTTRQRIALQTSPNACQVCHTKINALGFTLENFDAVGRYRTNENEREIDAHGGYTTRNGDEIELNGPQELTSFLANSNDAHVAFVDRAFKHFVKQPPAAFGDDTLDKLVESFRRNDFNIQKLIVDIAVASAVSIER